MIAVISILIFLCCILLVLAVLIQNPKGGGLAAGFQTGSQVMGVRRTADFLEKATWTLAIVILILSIASTSLTSGSSSAAGTETEASSTKDKATDFDGGKTAPAAQPAPMNNGNAQPPPATPQ